MIRPVRVNWAIAIQYSLLCVMMTPGWTNAESEDGVIEFYNANSDLPDAIAFGAFLDLVNATRKQGNARDLLIVAEALGIDLKDDRGVDLARSRSNSFANADAALGREKAVAGYDVLCTDNRASRSVEEIIDAMNAVDDIKRLVMERHFQATIDSLSAEDRNAFITYLRDLKTGIQYTRVDSRKMYEAGYGNIYEDVKQRCAALETAMTLQGDK